MPASYSVGDQPVPGAGYRLAEFLGRGGFGEVWKATAPGGAEAAVKIIRLGSREGRKELRALQLVKRIHHTHLVPIIAFWIKSDKGEILDDEAVLHADQQETAPCSAGGVRTMIVDSEQATAAFDSPGELIIAMGLGEQSLYDRLQQCRSEGLPGIPDEELLGYLEDSAGAIDYLNSPIHDLGSGPAGIQHCDIKPHNLVLVGGSVQVCDFGLARMMGADRATTAAASVGYAAPECLVQGKPSDSTDQYCLAVSFVELKTGQLPYRDLTMVAVMEAKRRDDLDLSKLPTAAQAVIRRATSSDPAKRYGSCREMVRALRSAMEGRSEAPLRVQQKRGLLGFVAAAIVFAAVAAGAVWTWHKYAPSMVGPSIKTNDTQTSDREADALLESGRQSLNARNYAAAVADLEKAARLKPGDARVYSRLGAAWMGQEKWEKAIASFTKAIQINPYDNDYVNRGRARMELEATDDAIADFVAATRLNPHNAAAFVALGSAYVEKDDPAHAVDAYDRAVGICSSDPQANFPLLNVRVFRANANILLGNKAAAADDLIRAMPLLRDDPQSARSVFDAAAVLARAYAKAGQYADAVKWAEKSGNLAPDVNSKAECDRMLKDYKAKLTKPGK